MLIHSKLFLYSIFGAVILFFKLSESNELEKHVNFLRDLDDPKDLLYSKEAFNYRNFSMDLEQFLTMDLSLGASFYKNWRAIRSEAKSEGNDTCLNDVAYLMLQMSPTTFQCKFLKLCLAKQLM